jgi:prepilin-type processing-associated H-X9-DG protein
MNRKLRTLARTTRERAFTLTDLVVCVAIIALLVCLALPALAGGKDRTRVAQCAANLRQFTLAMHVYGHEFGDKLPTATVGSWPLDMPWAVGSFVERIGSKWTTMYCPGTRVRFTDDDNYRLYTWAPNNYRIVGYALTFPGTAALSITNRNATLTPRSMPFGPVMLPTSSPAQQVLLADATLSQPGQSGEALRNTYNYTDIVGAYLKRHISAHLDSNLPAGGNVGMLDGHVEWRKFQDMHVRTVEGAGTPVFWW